MLEQTATNVNTVTNELRDAINDNLQKVNSPQLGLGRTAYDRADTFVQFNNWLMQADRAVLVDIANKYGLLPMVFSLSGLDVTDAMLLQQRSRLDLRGHIRYISITLGSVTGTRTNDVLNVGKIFFGDDFKTENVKTAELRTQFISSVIEYFVNTDDNIDYVDALKRFLELVRVN